MTRASKPSASELLRVLRAIEHGLQSASKLMAREAGVTAPQRAVLRVIAKRPGASASEVAEVVHLHASTVTGILHRLLERGLVSRAKSEADGRRIALEVTEAGKKASEARGGGADAAVRRALGGFSQAEIETAMRVLAAVSQELES